MDERGRKETGRGGDRMVAVIQRQTEQGRAREGGREREEERGRKKEEGREKRGGRKRTEEREQCLWSKRKQKYLYLL